MNYSKRLLSASILAFFLACSGDFKEITDEERQARLPQLSSSSEDLSSSSSEVGVSSSDSSSSSSDGQSSSSSEVGLSSGDSGSSSSEEQSSSSEEQSSSSFSDNSVYFCGDNLTDPYNPDTEDCDGNVLMYCDGYKSYDPFKFCYDDTVHDKCGGKPYDVDVQFCLENEIKDKCGGEEYESTQFCYNNSKVGYKCGINPQQTYDPDLYKCKPEINPNGIFLKEPVTYSGEYYDGVLIGTQVWLSRNLNYNAAGSKCVGASGTTGTLVESGGRCTTYGRLYNWAMALNISVDCNTKTLASCGVTLNTPHQGVCPFGWHIPSDAEWTTLTSYVETKGGCARCAGTKLKAASGWNGTDNHGFSALPGAHGYPEGNFASVGTFGTWWSSREEDKDSAYFRFMYSDRDSLGWYGYDKKRLRSVRCVKDSP